MSVAFDITTRRGREWVRGWANIETKMRNWQLLLSLSRRKAGPHGSAASSFSSDGNALSTIKGSCGGNDGPRLFAGEAE
jgi:hypothetical protein